MLKWKVGKVSVGTSATEIVAARSGRKSLKLWGFPASGGTLVYVKDSNAVAISDLNPVTPTSLLVNNTFQLDTEGAVWGITNSGSRDIWFLETYEE